MLQKPIAPGLKWLLLIVLLAGIPGCPILEQNLDGDGDGVSDSVDKCVGFDDRLDGDGDGIPDGCDKCEGSVDADDADEDGIPDACDQCAESPDAEDADADGVPDGCDRCEGFPDGNDADEDSVPDGCDRCNGFDDTADADGDQVADGCDVCAGADDTLDADNDGIPDACDFNAAFALDDLLNLATAVESGDAVELRNLQIGDKFIVSAPDSNNDTEGLATDECTCDWQVDPESAGAFDPPDECTTIYAVTRSGQAVLRVLRTCAGVQQAFSQGIAAEASRLVSADPSAAVFIFPSLSPCPVEACVNEETAVGLDGTDSAGSGLVPLVFRWRQTSGPAVALLDPADEPGSTRCCDPTEDDALADECTADEICALAIVTFIAPDVQLTTQNLDFELTVSEPGALTASDETPSDTTTFTVQTRNTLPPPPPSSSPPPPPTAVCGNNTVESGEQCDDGNTTDGDGCSSTCQTEAPPTGACCAPGASICVISTSADCTAAGGSYQGDASACTPSPCTVCGDMVLEGAEECDDGNTANGDGCDANCVSEVCGNGVLQSGETCDDGNTVGGDGCSATCTNECGDGTCDTNAGDSASYVENNATCAADCFCGDGILDVSEMCDGAADAICPGNCQGDCTCNGTIVTGTIRRGDHNPPGTTGTVATRRTILVRLMDTARTVEFARDTSNPADGTYSLTITTNLFDGLGQFNGKIVISADASQNVHIEPSMDEISLVNINVATISVGNQDFAVFYDIIASSVTGSDSNPGTLSQPLATPQGAADRVFPGDTVFFRGGTYDTTPYGAVADFEDTRVMTVSTNGTPSRPIVFRSYPQERATFDGRTINRHCIEVTGDYIRIAELSLIRSKRTAAFMSNVTGGSFIECDSTGHSTEPGSHDPGFRLLGDCRFCVIDRCEVFAGGHGIELRESPTVNGNRTYPGGVIPGGAVAPSDCTMQNNMTHDNHKPGPAADDVDGMEDRYGTRNRWLNNISFRNDDDGMDNAGCLDNTLAGNIVFDMNNLAAPAGNGGGIKVSTRGAGGNMVFGNISIRNRTRGFDNDDGQNDRYYNNISYGNGEWGFAIDFFGSTGNILRNNISEGNNTTNAGWKDAFLSPGADADYNFWADGMFNDDDAANTLSGDPLFVDPTFIASNGGAGVPDTTFMPQWSIDEKLEHIRSQVYTAFGLQSIAGGFPADSPCLDAGEDVGMGFAAVDLASVGNTGTGTIDFYDIAAFDLGLPTLAFSAFRSAADESAGTVTVSVRLTVTLGAATSESITIEVTDSGYGAARSGLDYAALGTATVTFPAGSTDGATMNVSLTIIDDADAEPNESVKLLLGTITSGNAQIAGARMHEVTINDND